MKHLLTFISFFIVVSLTTPHFVFADEQAQAVEIDLFIKSRPTKIDRSPDFAEVEAWYDRGTMTVTVEGCELKDTFIYIMSPDGLIFAQTSHYFGITPETCTIDAPSLPGKYWHIIDSPALYAEGVFLIN